MDVVTRQPSKETLRFLLNGGEAGALIARFDWSATPLGPIEHWPRSLKTAVSIVLRSPVAMTLLWGAEGIMIYNDGYAAIAGGRHPASLGSKARESWPEVAAFNDHVIRTVMAGQSLTYRDQPLELTRNGQLEKTWFTLDYSPVLDEADQPAGVIAVVVETTHRMLAETAARESEMRHRQILDSAIDYAIIAFDLHGKVTRWNAGAHRILGWTEPEMLGQDGSRIFTPEDRAVGRMEHEMKMALATGAGNDERWHLRKSGERFWANGEMTPIYDDTGHASGFVKVLRDRTSSHQAAQKLKQSDERLRRAQEAGGVGTFTVDLESNRIYATREFCRIFGLTSCDGVPAAEVEALVIPEDAELRSRSITRDRQTAPLDVEYRIRRADDGELRWISRKAEYEHNDEGRVISMVGVVLDVTQRKAAQAAVDESAEQFRTLAQTLPNHVWTAPPDGLLDWFNARVYEYSGAAPGTLDGQGWASLVHADDLAAASQRWQASLASGEPYETEFRVRRADGAYRWHLVRALPLRSADGSVRRWIGTNTDIDERKRSEVESMRDRDRIWTLSQELMLVCDFEGTISAVNPAATRLLGWRMDEMVGARLEQFVHAEDVAATTAELDKLMSGATTLAFENRYLTKDGSYRLLDWTAVPNGAHVHGVARDVTRERSAEDALRQSQKMEAVGQLTGGVAHDFNNLLTIIRTSIDLLRRPNLAEDRRLRFMESISNAVNRAAKLTGQLLAFARRQALKPVAFDVAQNVRSVSDMIGTLVGARIEVELVTSTQACVVHADPSQFDTAIVNMAVNARDAMNGAGRLTIAIARVAAIPSARSHLEVPGQFIAISLTDTGTGIDPAQIEKIFEPFFTTKGVGLGTGLGLSQVFGFAKQSGGDIQVRSVPGSGSTFTLYLPQAEGDGIAAEATPAQAAANGRGACILVVEDNPEVAASVEETLREIGYTTALSRGADAALAELESGAARFSAVFSDVVMAGMDGIQLAREIRRRHPELPVVLSSGYSDVLAKGDAHGFDLLPKPYSVDALSQMLSEAVARRSDRPAARPPFRASAFSHLLNDVPALQESARLDELEALQLLGTEPETQFDDLTRMAATLCNTPIALISLIDRDRQWFKSRIGLDTPETPREQAFCAHAIQQPNNVMVVQDASRDPRFVDNPLVTGDPNIRFYAGAPLVTSAGNALGTLCVIDYQARAADPKQMQILQLLATEVVKRMEQRSLDLEAKP